MHAFAYPWKSNGLRLMADAVAAVDSLAVLLLGILASFFALFCWVFCARVAAPVLAFLLLCCSLFKATGIHVCCVGLSFLPCLVHICSLLFLTSSFCNEAKKNSKHARGQ